MGLWVGSLWEWCWGIGRSVRLGNWEGLGEVLWWFVMRNWLIWIDGRKLIVIWIYLSDWAHVRD
jgi:hypothetical protein